MKFKNFNKIFTIQILTVIFLIHSTSTQLYTKTCNIDSFLKIGIKAFCECKEGLSADCATDSRKVRKVYINCDPYYHNEKNLSQQIIYCMDDGNWSEEPMKCTPECTDYPKTFESIDVNNLKIPTSYAEIIRKFPKEGEINVFPGIIVSARHILTKKEYFRNISLSVAFVIRIYESKSKFKEFGSVIHGGFFKYKTNESKYYTLHLNSFKHYIRFNETVQPACRNSLNFTVQDYIFDTSGDHNYINYKLSRSCHIPHIDHSKNEMQCYQSIPKLENCSNEKTAHRIKIYCQIGHENKILNKTDNLISECSANIWTIYGDMNKCESICGEIDTKYKPIFPKLMYKGLETDITSAPWHVGIYINSTIEDPTDFQQVCGGTIIHSNIVISAGHCFYDDQNDTVVSPINYLVGAGKRYRNYHTDEEFNFYTAIANIYIHPGYQHTTTRNDIAILTLNHHLKFTSHIKPACINWDPSIYNNIPAEGIEGHIFGWGATSDQDISNTELLTINLTTLTNKQCKRRLDPNYRTEITGDIFCAVNENNGTACRGDSGGGFFIKKKIDDTDQFRYFLTGIISRGTNSNDKYCSAGFMTLFTNLKYYQGIIKTIISENRDALYYRNEFFDLGLDIIKNISNMYSMS